MTRSIPPQAVDFVARHEGKRLTAYKDAADVWTIGYGHTSPEVCEGMKITEAKARELLAEDLMTAACRLERVVKPTIIDELTDNQYAALLSFVFNLGANPKWTIWKRLNARQFDQVPIELIRFVNAGGKKLQGLVNRRAAEVSLWSTGEPGSAPAKPPSTETRVAETPPTPAEPKALAKSGTLWAGGVAAAGGVVQGASQVQAIIAPQAMHNEWLAKAMGFVAVLIVLGGLAVMAFKYLDHKKATR